MSRFIGETTVETRIRNLEQAIAKLERRQPQAISFQDATRVRVRLGRQDDGTYGLKVWNAAGALVHNYTA